MVTTAQTGTEEAAQPTLLVLVHLVGQVMGIAAAFSAGTFLVGTPQGAGQLQPAVPNTDYFGSFPTVHYMRVLGISVQHLIKWPGVFYMKSSKFAQRALICTDILVNGFEVCRMENKHYCAFLNKDICFIS